MTRSFTCGCRFHSEGEFSESNRPGDGSSHHDLDGGRRSDQPGNTGLWENASGHFPSLNTPRIYIFIDFIGVKPIAIRVVGTDYDEVRKHAEKIAREMKQISFLRDVGFEQTLDYPTSRLTSTASWRG